MKDLNQNHGKAGEHLVCADLLCKGLAAFLVEGTARYDVVTEIKNKLVRIQVKTTLAPTAYSGNDNDTLFYKFRVSCYGKNQRIAYKKSDADIIAFVCLDRKIVAYLPFNKVQSYRFRTKSLAHTYAKHNAARYIEDCTFEKAIKNIKIS